MKDIIDRLGKYKHGDVLSDRFLISDATAEIERLREIETAVRDYFEWKYKPLNEVSFTGVDYERKLKSLVETDPDREATDG